MDEGGFFGFDTSLPPVRRGPQQELGDVELEDTYDALNDETFGVINPEDDWEEEHEKLAEYLGELPKNENTKTMVDYTYENFEESAYPGPQPIHLRNAHVNKDGNVEFEADNNEDAANVAASVSQILLDDDDIDNIISRPINYSRSMENKLFGQMSPQSSIFDTDIVGSPSTPSIWSTQPSDIRKAAEDSPKVKPVISNGNTIPPVSERNLLQEGLFKTVEELERHLLQQPKRLTMEELERNLLSNRSLPANSIRSVEEIEAEFTRAQNSKQMGMPPPPPPHLQQFMRLPPPIGLPLPPPTGAPMPHPMHLPLPLPLPGTRPNGPMPPLLSETTQWTRRPHHSTNQPSYSSNDSSKAHVHEHRHTTTADNYDEYAGLMSTKEKQWLMSIQINQLISDNPYVEDYYFTVLRLRCLGKLHPGRDTKEGPKLIMPGKAKTEPRTYAPTQFANSLGKLQVVTYTAPRRILDVSISQASPDSGQDPQLAVKDMRKFKQILLDIEKMYVWLLDLEDAEMRVESLPTEAEPGPLHQAVADYQNKLQSFLSTGDKLQQVMLVRKGKVLILRAFSHFTFQYQELIVRTILLNCLLLIRRDTHDHVLVRFLPLVNDILASLEDLQGLVSMAQLIETAQKNSGYGSVTSTKMGFDLISLIMCRGTELMPKCSDESIRNQWAAFVCGVGNAIVASSTAPKSDLGLLNLEPFQQVGMDEQKLHALKIVLETLTNVGHEV